MTTWIEDSNGNKCSVEYFGTREKAQAALDSLVRCRRCVNCSDCSDCSDCSRCSRCADCYDCSSCADCYRCYSCVGCSDCSDCSRCSDCSNCSRCSDCYDCVEGKATTEIKPVANLANKVREAIAVEGALDMLEWGDETLKDTAPCGTPFCLAGHIVNAAGKEGYSLKDKTSWAFAAFQIAKASGVTVRFPWFYELNEQAAKRIEKL